MNQSDSEFRLLYIYDALCGWCYGFSPHLNNFLKQHSQELEMEVISGGMITGERIGPIGEVAGYIAQAYRVVEEKCGVKFGESFLKEVMEDGSTTFTSVPAAVALSIVKEKHAEQAFVYAHKIQRAIYFYGKSPAETSTFTDLAEDLKLEIPDFAEKMQSETYQRKAENDFQLTAGLGVQGFPAVILIKGEEGRVLNRGFIPQGELERVYQAAKEELS